MLWADIAILSIIGISALISVFRGLIREVLSLVAWVLAFYAGFRFNQPLAGLFEPLVSYPSARTAAAFLLLFFSVLIVVGTINWLIMKLIASTGLSGTDRVLGVIFGVARGVAVVTVLVLLLGLTPVPRDPWWQESMFIGHFQRLALQVRDELPPSVAEHIHY